MENLQVNELRIGLSFLYFDRPTTLHNETELLKAFDDLKFGFLTPIPLTEDWLLRLGFVASKELPNDIFVLHLSKGCYIGIALTKDGNNVCLFIQEVLPSYIQYVHQLQNLIHALTGEELKINL